MSILNFYPYDLNNRELFTYAANQPQGIDYENRELLVCESSLTEEEMNSLRKQAFIFISNLKFNASLREKK